MTQVNEMHSAKIIILCAIYAEAEPLIDYFDLKRSFKDFKLDSYARDDGQIALFITGTGIVRAATAVGAVCTYFSISEATHIVNLGTCAGGSERAGLYRINKLVDAASDRTFYPDIWLKSDISEAAITTVPRVVFDASQPDMLYDMEAAAIYEAASSWLGPHQMTFLKIVSDRGTKEAVTREAVTELVRHYLPELVSFINTFINEVSAFAGQEALVSREYVEQLAEDMHCSVTMSHQLTSLLIYASLTGADYKDFFGKYYENGSCIISDKKAARQVIDEFKNSLIGE